MAGSTFRGSGLNTERYVLTVNLRLYAPDEGGRSKDVLPGWRCPCFPVRNKDAGGYDCLPLLTEPLSPGESRKVELHFLSRDAVETLRLAKMFFLWEGRFVAEAAVAE